MSDLSKCTIPQLKALCKERQITGYSKLSKAALLQKLVTTALSTGNATTTAAPTDEAQNGQHQPVQLLTKGGIGSTGVFTAKVFLPTEPPKTTVARVTSTLKTSGTKRSVHTNISAIPKRIRISTNIDCLAPRNSTSQLGTLHVDPSAPSSLADTVPRVVPTQNESITTSRIPPLTELPISTHDRTVTNTASILEGSGTTRPTHTVTYVAPKQVKISLKSTINADHPTPTFQQKAPVFKVPELSTRSIHSGAPTTAIPKHTSIANKRSATPHQVRSTNGPGRFKPLVVSRLAVLDQANGGPSPAPVVDVTPGKAGSALVINILATPFPVLTQISLPPKASERKWVYQWAIMLSEISSTDRQTCMLVSRMFRYAVYLSAVHILSRNFAGRRLDAIFEQYPKNMTNLWPYHRFRTLEVSERRRAFQQSFLGRFTNSIGYDPLSEHLWTNPDDEKQVDIALRFVLTRMWLAISIGAYGHDASSWSTCVVQDVQEVIKGEVWQVVTRHNTGTSCSFYVLEATCEVIGRPPSSQGQSDMLGYDLRADWATWISERSRVPLDTTSSLLTCVKWAHAADYDRGISKAWLRRIQDQDTDSAAKRIVAERYILACVVANGISGQWMSTSAMAQEFAGLPGKHALDARVAGRTTNMVNLYLPAHHHIESVHFTTSKGEALHDAVAVVQTPGREYYILRDSGMQVGCEEDGIPELWQKILGCDVVGRAR